MLLGARMGAGVRVEYPRSTWSCASAPRSRDSEPRGTIVFRSGSIPSSSSSVPRGQRPGDRPIYPWRRASLRLLETAEDLPTRRRSAVSGGDLRVAIWDVAPVERVMPPLLTTNRPTILVDEGEPVASNVDVMIAEI